VRRLTNQVAELVELPASARIHRRRVALSELFEAIDTDAAIPISQNQLAPLARTRLCATNRVLSDAPRRGVLEIRRRRIVVRDWRTVRRLRAYIPSAARCEPMLTSNCRG
jgi:hypothetical protein